MSFQQLRIALILDSLSYRELKSDFNAWSSVTREHISLLSFITVIVRPLLTLESFGFGPVKIIIVSSLPITVSGWRLKYFFATHRYTFSINNPEREWLAPYFYRVSTRIRHSRRLRFSYEEHENPVRYKEHGAAINIDYFVSLFHVIDAERRPLEINKDANDKNERNNFQELL